ncbi:hypothetical protein VKT23_019353 [Stygiomarasmius scandens]|uniref:F-box domain-containing protein n=1 Tax=Marasmiellus scandens TaxID=2682957 RepID=A0ABR1IPM7_9AGAR
MTTSPACEGCEHVEGKSDRLEGIASFLTPFLDSNEVPSEINEALLRQNLQIVRSRIAVLDRQCIATTPSAAHGELKELEYELISVLSPLRRLPAEILAWIFLLSLKSRSCSEEDSDVERELREYLDLFSNARRGTGPWGLSWVCSRWRAVTLSTPSLWARFSLKLPLCAPGDRVGNILYYDRGTLSLFNTAMERAGNHLLDFVFHMPPPSPISNDTFKRMLQVRQKWRHVYLVIPVHMWKIALEHNMHLPQLRTIGLRLLSEGDLGDVCISAPNLVRVLLDAPNPYQYLNMPLNRVTHLELYTSGSQLRNILTRATHLRYLKLFGLYTNDAPDTSDEWMIHTSLEKLALSGSAMDGISSGIKLPSLTHLTLDGFHDPRHFIRTVADSLQSLTIHACIYPADDAERLFSTALNIKELQIQEWMHMEKHILEQLPFHLTPGHDHGNVVFLKRLERMKFFGSECKTWPKAIFEPDGTLVKMITSRTCSPLETGLAQLRELELIGRFEDFDASLRSLKKLETKDFVVKLQQVKY